MADGNGYRWAWAVTGKPTAAELTAATARYSARFGCFPSILFVDPLLMADGLQAPLGVAVEVDPHMGRGMIAFAAPGDDAATAQEEAQPLDQGNGIDAALLWGDLDAMLEQAEQLSFAEWFFAPRPDGGAAVSSVFPVAFLASSGGGAAIVDGGFLVVMAILIVIVALAIQGMARAGRGGGGMG